jgi:hypothetical protein
VVEEEVIEAQAVATLRGCGRMVSFLLLLIPTTRFLFLDSNRTVWIVVLEEQLVASYHEMKGAHPREGPSGESRHQGAAVEPDGGLALMGDSAAAAEAAAAIVKMRGSLRGCCRFPKWHRVFLVHPCALLVGEVVTPKLSMRVICGGLYFLFAQAIISLLLFLYYFGFSPTQMGFHFLLMG